MLGKPIPDNVAEMNLDELHALHAEIWAERAELKAKHARLKPYIDIRQREADDSNRADYDLVIGQGSK